MSEAPKFAGLDDAAVTAYRSALKTFIRRRVATSIEADDLVQEAFTRLYTASANTRIAEPQAYLFRIAANLVIDHRRRSKTPFGHMESYEDDHSPPTPPDQEAQIRQQDLQRLFEVALAELPDRRRKVFLMKRFEDKSTLVIAAQLCITPRMVQKHLVLAASHLFERLRPYIEDEQ